MVHNKLIFCLFIYLGWHVCFLLLLSWHNCFFGAVGLAQLFLFVVRLAQLLFWCCWVGTTVVIVVRLARLSLLLLGWHNCFFSFWRVICVTSVEFYCCQVKHSDVFSLNHIIQSVLRILQCTKSLSQNFASPMKMLLEANVESTSLFLNSNHHCVAAVPQKTQAEFGERTLFRSKRLKRF